MCVYSEQAFENLLDHLFEAARKGASHLTGKYVAIIDLRFATHIINSIERAVSLSEKTLQSCCTPDLQSNQTMH